MQPISPAAVRYDRVTIALHWATAIIVVGQWLGAQVIDWFPRGPLRVDARSVHITVGVTLAALLVARLLWRSTAGRRLPPANQGALHLLAKGTHWLLYALLIAMVTIGMLLTWARGDSLFNLFSIPPLDPANPALRHQLEDLHNLVGYCILGLAGLHAMAALVHRLLWRDGVLGRMRPGH